MWVRFFGNPLSLKLGPGFLFFVVFKPCIGGVGMARFNRENMFRGNMFRGRHVLQQREALPVFLLG